MSRKMQKLGRTVEADVLVIGSEGAGSRAAIEASKNGAKVTIVTKGRVGKCGVTMLAGADMMLDGASLHKLGFPGNPKDSKENFFRDIIVEGFYLNNQRLVEVYVDNAAQRVREVIDWGLKVLGHEDRAIITSGVEIVNALRNALEKCNLNLVEDTMIAELLTNERRVVGALGVDIKTGEFTIFKSKAVVLATGGWHRGYSFTSGTNDLTGDGQAMAYRAGAELIDMEMVTFCPNVILYPPMYRGSIFTYVTHARLLNRKNESFMDKYDADVREIAETTEWNKLIHSIASMREIVEGWASEHGGVYWSLRHLSRTEIKDIGRKNPFVLGWKFQGTDYSDLMERVMQGYDIEVAPAAHYFEGGIEIDESCATSIEGLYAAGECTGGLFGANRVSAATTEMLVEGAIAGEKAAEYASNVDEVSIDMERVRELQEKISRPLENEKGLRVVDLRKRVQELAYKNIGVLRDDEHLREAVEQLRKIGEEDLPRVRLSSRSLRYNLEWIEALQLENMIQVLQISARSASMREESRGVHYRADRPMTDNDHWLRNIVAGQVNGELKLTTKPVIVTRVVPPKGVMRFEDSIREAVKALRG